ncbi:unnamed protein product [Effrenium voratum]|nr:unnamed protein product [Effrenium voratum]
MSEYVRLDPGENASISGRFRCSQTQKLVWLLGLVLTLTLRFSDFSKLYFASLAFFVFWSLGLVLTEPPDVPELRPVENVLPDLLWCRDYFIYYGGTTCYARMTIIRLSDGSFCVHSPSPFDEVCEQFFGNRRLSYLLAPGDMHHFHIVDWARRFPHAVKLICPGVEQKQPSLLHDGFIHDYLAKHVGSDAFTSEFEAVASEGFGLIREVVMYHKPSRHLLLVDLVEYIGDGYVGYNRCLRVFWWCFGMWNRPKPAPEYQFSVQDQDKVRQFLGTILTRWEIRGIILAHGTNVLQVGDHESKEFLRRAWAAWL